MARSPLFPRWNRQNSNQQQQASAQSSRTGQTQQYGMRSWLKRQVVDKVSKELGDVGTLLLSLIRPSGKTSTQEIESAVEEALQQQGEIVPARPEIPTRRDPVTNIEPDDWRQFPPDKPTLEGMFDVVSSNVHSIGYLHPGTHGGNGDMLVRFLGTSGKHRVGPGPLYRYRDVPVEVWNTFKYADSYGRAVWTDLRILGSVSGHQYAYDLEEAGSNGYVPRQAVVSKRGEIGQYFVPRTLGGVRSPLPQRKIGRAPRTTIQGWDRRSNLQLRHGR